MIILFILYGKSFYQKQTLENMIYEKWGKIAYTINIFLGNKICGGVKFVSHGQLKPGK